MTFRFNGEMLDWEDSGDVTEEDILNSGSGSDICCNGDCK